MVNLLKSEQLTAEAVKAAIMKWPGRYETEEGRQIWGVPVSGLATALREAGWRNVPPFDSYECKKMGLEVVSARYVGGARPKRFCEGVVAAERKTERE